LLVTVKACDALAHLYVMAAVLVKEKGSTPATFHATLSSSVTGSSSFPFWWQVMATGLANIKWVCGCVVPSNSSQTPVTVRFDIVVPSDIGFTPTVCYGMVGVTSTAGTGVDYGAGTVVLNSGSFRVSFPVTPSATQNLTFFVAINVYARA
jgi:hypothetical protein